MIQKASTEFIEKYGVATRPHYLSAVRREIAERVARPARGNPENMMPTRPVL